MGFWLALSGKSNQGEKRMKQKDTEYWNLQWAIMMADLHERSLLSKQEAYRK